MINETTKSAKLITRIGMAMMIVFGIIWAFRGGITSDFDMVLISINVSLFGLVGQLINKPVDTSEKRTLEEK